MVWTSMTVLLLREIVLINHFQLVSRVDKDALDEILAHPALVTLVQINRSQFFTRRAVGPLENLYVFWKCHVYDYFEATLTF